MSKYGRVADELRAKIEDGAYAPGDRLPTIPELCEAFGVSKITIKRAMDELAQQGLVSRRRGSGTYVKGVPASMRGTSGIWGTKPLVTGFTEDHESQGELVHSVVHALDVVRPNPQIALGLAVDEDSFCYRLERTRYANSVPRAFEIAHIPVGLAPNLRVRDAEKSLFRYVTKVLGLKIESVHRRISAVHPPQEVARRLDIDESDAILRIVQTSFLDDGRPFELTVSYHEPSYEYLGVETS